LIKSPQTPPPTQALPDAEATLAALASAMREGIAADAKLVGIYSGGAWLAERLGELLPGNHPVGYIDVSFYRDDYGKKGLHGRVETTTRAAINELFDFGRPESIELAVLVDRGGRELPIEAKYVGARLSVAPDRSIVLSRHLDGRLDLSIEDAEGASRG
jgi:pyrimidine operon attenuation protein/uracil phosphoribosyltransferase